MRKAAVFENGGTFKVMISHAIFGTVIPHPLLAVRGTVIPYLCRPLLETRVRKFGVHRSHVARQVTPRRKRRVAKIAREGLLASMDATVTAEAE